MPTCCALVAFWQFWRNTTHCRYGALPLKLTPILPVEECGKALAARCKGQEMQRGRKIILANRGHNPLHGADASEAAAETTALRRVRKGGTGD